MKTYYEDSWCRLFLGDARAVLPTFADASVDFIFTDAPYGHNNNNNGDLIHRWLVVPSPTTAPKPTT